MFRSHAPLGSERGNGERRVLVQSQLAQNVVLSWLGGARIFELNPRPCIDMQTIGYNVEWSQELKLEQSLDEYVKGMMLIQILQASGRLEIEPGFEPLLFDMSVGYDLEGIRSDRVKRSCVG